MRRLMLLWVCLVPSAAGQSSATLDVPYWQQEPFDRIELTNGHLHDIYPQRLPEGFAPKPDVQAGGYVGAMGLPPMKTFRGLKRFSYRVKLRKNGSTYIVEGKAIKNIFPYEDLLIREAMKLTEEKKFDDAWEYLRALQERDATWAGFAEAKVQYLWSEADHTSLQGNYERAFWLFVEALRLAKVLPPPDPGRLSELQLLGITAPTIIRSLEESTGRWVARATLRDDYAEGRRVVARLERVLPDSGKAATLRREFADKAETQLEAYRQRLAATDMVGAFDALWQAVRIVPDYEPVTKTLAEFWQKHPVLRVAADRMPGYYHGPAGWTANDQRTSRLLHLPLALLAGQDDGQFSSQILDTIDRERLNTRATIRVRAGLKWPGDGKPVTGNDVSRLLIRAAQPGTALYHPAWAQLVSNIEVTPEGLLHIDFARPQPRPAIWLQMPFFRIGPQLVDPSADSPTVGTVGLGPFRLADKRIDRAVFLANESFVEAGKPLLQQIREVRIDEMPNQIEALTLGEVDIIAHIPPRHFKTIDALDGVKVVRHSVPQVHLLLFRYDSVIMQNRTLRRAMDYAIDRSKVFEAVQLPMGEDNRPISGPLPYGAFGYDTSIANREPDLALARALFFAAKADLGLLPSLTLAHGGTETTRLAAADIVRQLKLAGIQVQLIDTDREFAFDPMQADIRYVTYTVGDPVFDLISLLTRDMPTLAENASPWVRKQIVDLINVPNYAAARDLLPAIHRMVHEETLMIPLYQWYDSSAFADRVGGVSSDRPALYHRAADWTVTPKLPAAEW